MQNKMCDINNNDRMYRRIYEDFNPYGYNIYLTKKEYQDELKKYGRTNHDRIKLSKK